MEKENPSKMPMRTCLVAVREGHLAQENSDSVSFDVQPTMVDSEERRNLEFLLTGPGGARMTQDRRQMPRDRAAQIHYAANFCSNSLVSLLIFSQ